MEHPDKGMLFSTKKKELSRHEKTWRSLSERSQCEVYILYDSHYMTFWKRQNDGDSERISVCQGLGHREG